MTFYLNWIITYCLLTLGRAQCLPLGSSISTAQKRTTITCGVIHCQCTEIIIVIHGLIMIKTIHCQRRVVKVHCFAQLLIWHRTTWAHFRIREPSFLHQCPNNFSNIPFLPFKCLLTPYLIFVIFLHRQNFWRIKFTPKNAYITTIYTVNCQFYALNL